MSGAGIGILGVILLRTIDAGPKPVTRQPGGDAERRVFEQEDVQEFLRQATRVADARIEAGGPGEEPHTLAEFKTLGLLSAQEETVVVQRYSNVRGQIAREVASLRQRMNANSVEDRLREAQLEERLQSFDAMLYCIAQRQYLTAPMSGSAAITIPGYRIYNDAASKAGAIVRLVLPIRMAGHPTLDAAVRYKAAVTGEYANERARGFNALGSQARNRLLELWQHYRRDKEGLTPAEQKEIEAYLVLESRFDLETKTARVR
jgi:hypothetical protein